MSKESRAIDYMNVIRYYRDSRPWTSELTNHPSWNDVEAAVRRMDNYCFPIVQLGRGRHGEDDNEFNIIGGNGRIALFHLMGNWQYADPNGSQAETQLWDSDQGYYCLECNVLTDIEKVLRITKAFYDTGSYDNLDNIE